MATPCRLYIISPPQIALDHFTPLFERVIATGLVASFQLRLKDTATQDAQFDPSRQQEDILRACDRLLPLAQAADVAFILNDHADLVKKSGADGCHLGQSDMACRQARQLLGDEAVIGVTCHNSRHLAFVAGEDGADYVAFGAFYPSTTKQVSHQAEPDILSWWQEIAEIPCVAIGGITADNAAPLAQAGADFIAVSGTVWNADKNAGKTPEIAIQELASAIGLTS